MVVTFFRDRFGGNMLKTGWVSRVGAAGVLSLVVGGAFVFLASDALWPTATAQELGAESPLAFDAPTWAVARANADEKAGHMRATAVVQGTNEIVVIDDWNYTAIVRGRPQPSKHK